MNQSEADMSKFNEIDNTLSVSGQITEEDISDAANRGFKTIINLRPDGEQADAIPASKAKAIANSFGLDYQYLPVKPAMITDDIVNDFAILLSRVKGPVLAHCGSGMRATVLWALSLAGSKSTREIVEVAARAGFDLTKVAARSNQRALCEIES